jgi:hypothetical protein
MSGPLPGTIGLTTISGNVGRAIEVGEWLNGEGFARWEHAFVLLPGNQILEAEPGGARIVPLHYADVFWCRHIRTLLPVTDTPNLLSDLAGAFRQVGYSALDYAALALHRLHVPAPGLKDFIASTGHEICSQMVDDYYQRLGGHIFDDGRWPGYVTPASLYRRELELEAQW